MYPFAIKIVYIFNVQVYQFIKSCQHPCRWQGRIQRLKKGGRDWKSAYAFRNIRKWKTAYYLLFCTIVIKLLYCEVYAEGSKAKYHSLSGGGGWLVNISICTQISQIRLADQVKSASHIRPVIQLRSAHLNRVRSNFQNFD